MRRTASRPARLLALVAAALLLAVTSAAGAAGPADAATRRTTTTTVPPPPPAHVALASQTSWVAPGQELALRLRIETPAPPGDIELGVTVYHRLLSRTEYTASLVDRVRGTVLFAPPPTTLAELAPDAGGAYVVRIPVRDPAAAVIDRSRLRLDSEGVYPVRVEVRQGSTGIVLDRLTTHLIYAVPPDEGSKLAFAWVLPLQAPLALQPDGTRHLDPAGVEALATLARGLAPEASTAPVTLLPTPETLESLAASARPDDVALLGTLVRATRERQVAQSTYLPLSLPAFSTPDLADEAGAQLERGNALIESVLKVRPSGRTWVTDEHLDDLSVQRLRDRQVDRLVVPESTLVPVNRNTTLAQPFELDSHEVRHPVVLAADDGLAAHLAAPGDQVLAGHQLLADLAQIYFDNPGRPRAVVALSPRSGRTDPALLETVLAGLASSPIVQGSTLDDVFATVPPAANPTSGAATAGPGTTPLVRSLSPAPPSAPPLPAVQLRSTRRRVNGFSSMVQRSNPLSDELEELLFAAESEAPGSRAQHAAYIDAIERTLRRNLALLHLPLGRTITLTSQGGQIPITVASDAGYELHVQVALSSTKLSFPSGATRTIDLTRRNTTERFAVETRAAGSFPLLISLVSPDGGLTVGPRRFTVRSTATSGAGLVLSIGAGGFLLVWWARHLARGRRNRRLVPA